MTRVPTFFFLSLAEQKYLFKHIHRVPTFTTSLGKTSTCIGGPTQNNQESKK